jgi:hypothetical protein
MPKDTENLDRHEFIDVHHPDLEDSDTQMTRAAYVAYGSEKGWKLGKSAAAKKAESDKVTLADTAKAEPSQDAPQPQASRPA